jgi:hypothetical protein
LITSRSLLLALLTIGYLAASAASAQACTKTWVGGSGSWGEENSWSPKGVPGGNDEVCITGAGTYTVTLEPYTGELSRPANGDTVKSLTVGGSSGNQTLDIEGQSSISISNEQVNVVSLTVSGGMAQINPTGTLTLNATALNTHGLKTAGNEPGGSATFAGTLLNYGHIESQVQDSKYTNNLESSVTNEADGNIQVNSGALKVGYPNTYPVSGSNDGVLTVDPGASLQLSSGDPSGANAYENDGSVVNDGSITVSGGEAKWTQSGGSVSGNEVVLENGATLADSAGTGVFLGNHDSVTVMGTIPAGQTVTVRGEPFSLGGETYYSTTLNGGGKELVNDGTLVFNPTGSGEVSGGGVDVEAGSIHNNGLIEDETETATRVTQLLEGLTNGPAGRLEVNGGIFQGNNGAATTNEGLVTVAPGAVYQLQEGASFVNESDGTLSPQIAGTSSFGAFQMSSPCCSGPGTFTAGGTLLPVLLGGFVPGANEEFHAFLLSGGTLTGTFATVGNGFSADYSHETSEGAYVGIVYHAAGGATTTTTGTGSASKPPPPLAHLQKALKGGRGDLTVTLSCPPAGAACAAATLRATVTEHLKGGKITAITARKRKAKTGARTRQVLIASADVTLAAGTTKTLTVTLNAVGRALLDRYGKLTTKVTIDSGASTLESTILILQRPKQPKKRK